MPRPRKIMGLESNKKRTAADLKKQTPLKQHGKTSYLHPTAFLEDVLSTHIFKSSWRCAVYTYIQTTFYIRTLLGWLFTLIISILAHSNPPLLPLQTVHRAVKATKHMPSATFSQAEDLKISGTPKERRRRGGCEHTYG